MNEQETIADIIAEMRGFKRYAASDSSDCRYAAYWLYQTFADRIEAAARREMEKVSSCSVRSTKEAARIIMRNGAVNAAKMYEALINISKYADCAAMRQHDAHTQHYIEQIRKWAEAALAAPPRNCDMPLVVDGPADNNADKAWLVFKRHNPDAYFDVSGLLRCIDWLFAPATEKEGGDNANE